MKYCHRFQLRYGYYSAVAVVAVAIGACADTGTSSDPIAAHAEVAIGDQRDLWRQRAGSLDLARLQSGTGEVTVAEVSEIGAMPATQGEQRIPEHVGTQVFMERVPDRALGSKPLVTRGRVLGVQAQMLIIETPEGTIQLHARVGGRTLALTEGDEVDVDIQIGTPFRRSDYVQVRGEKDALGYALVGGESPVTIELSFFDLTARQEGRRADDNSMGVTVRVGDESQRVDKVGETLHFQAAGLFVQVLASIAADEHTAAVLPESHRLEIAIWPDGDGR